MVDKNREEMHLSAYQMGTENLGKPTRNQQMNLIDIVESSTKSRMIKDKKRKDETKDQLDQLHKFLKDLSSPISLQSTTLETPIFLSKKEAHDLVEMRNKVGMLDR